MNDVHPQAQTLLSELSALRERIGALEGSERALRMLADQLPGVVWTTDGALRFTSSGGSGLAALGLTPTQVVGLSLFEYFGSDDPEFLPIAAHRRALSGESGHYEVAWQGREYISFVEPLRETDQRIIGVVGLAIDLTEEGRAERALRAAHDELERVVAARAADISAANLRLVHEIEERRQFEARLRAVNKCLACLGVETEANLQRLTVVAGEILGATCALYQRIEGDRLRTVAGWNLPAEHPVEQGAEGHPITDLVRSDGEDRVILRKLQESSYAASDALIGASGLKTLAAHTVRVGRHAIGAVAVGFDADCVPPGDELQVLGVLAAAISAQEERASAEAALRSSEERYRRLVESLHDRLIYVRRTDGHLAYVGPSSVHVVGFTPREILGHVRERLTDHPVNLVAEANQALSNRGVLPPPFEIEVFHKDGSKRRLEVAEFPIHDEQGAVIEVEGLALDITQRKRQEEQLRDSEERFRQLTENIDEVFWMTSVAQDRILYVSPAYETLWGRSCADLHASPLSWMDGIHPEDQDRVREAASARQLNGEYDEEYRVVRPDGTIRWIRDRAFPVRDAHGEVYRIAGLAEDITERKQTEERMRSIVDTALDGIVTIDSDGIIHSFNPAAERIFGYGAGEVLGQHVRVLMPEEVRERGPELVKWYLRRGLGAIGEGVGRHRDGSTFPIELAVTELKTGSRRFFTGVVRDITKRKRAETTLVGASRMEATVTLAGGVAHDFNNLMAVVLTDTELLRQSLADRPSDLEMVEEISDLARRGGSLAQQLVAFARGGKTRSEIVDLNSIVDDVCALQRRTIPPGIKVVMRLSPDLWPVDADPTQMGQIVVNLTINAVEAIGAHGTIEIDTRNVELDEAQVEHRTGLEAGPHVLLSVRDGGCGMDASTLTRVFEPFFTTKFQGRGLGLAATYGIVKNHGGHIAVTSEPGQGSRFEVFLPAKAPPDSAG